MISPQGRPRENPATETAGAVNGYMIAWSEPDAYFIDNIAVDPARQGQGLGRQLIDHAADEAARAAA